MEYAWTLGTLQDIDEVVAMAEQHFQKEIDTIFKPEPPAYARNLAFAVLHQTYYPGSHLFVVAREEETNKLLAYHWANSGDRAWWSDDLMVNIRMVHMDMTLSPRLRVKIIKDMMDHWERFARYAKNPIICSSTMRHDQDAFLKLHERAGYSVRGSFAYKRLEL
jgi:hypothetical protein